MATSPTPGAPRATDVPARARNPRGQGQRLRAALIDAAIELLTELDDIDALSIRAVTQRAGVTPTALYLHFADKEELISAVKERCFDELRSYVLAGQARYAPDPRRALEGGCLAYIAFAVERSGHYHVLFHTRRSSSIPRPTTDSSGVTTVPGPLAGAEAFGDLVRGVERCLPDGSDAFRTATMIWAGMHGYVGLRTLKHFPFPPASSYIKLLLDAQLSAAATAS